MKHMIFFFMLLSFPVFSDETAGTELGKMSWPQAVESCSRLKMRLPTSDELQKLFTGESAGKLNEKNSYWTSEDVSPKHANVWNGVSGTYTFIKGNPASVRCIK